MRTTTTVFATALAVFVPAGVAEAIITIDPGNVVLSPGGTYPIPIMISSSPAVQIDAVALDVQFGDGGSVGGGTDFLTIESVSYIGAGHVFDGNAAPQQDGLVGFGIYQGSEATLDGTVAANGILATLMVVVLAETPVGFYDIILRGGLGMNTQVFGPNCDAGAGEIECLSEVLVGSILPEPNGALFAAAFALCFLVRRTRSNDGALGGGQHGSGPP
jgi:hypothetical protein